MLEHDGAGRLQHHHRQALLDVGGEDLRRILEDPARHGQLPGGMPGQAPADELLRDDDLVAQHLQGLDGGLRGAGVELGVERVWPEDDALLAGVGFAFRGPLLQRLRGEADERPAGVQATGARQECGDARGVHGPVHQAWHDRELVRDVAEQRQPAHEVVGAGADAAGVVVVQELGFVGGHIHVDGAHSKKRFTLSPFTDVSAGRRSVK